MKLTQLLKEIKLVFNPRYIKTNRDLCNALNSYPYFKNALIEKLENQGWWTNDAIKDMKEENFIISGNGEVSFNGYWSMTFSLIYDESDDFNKVWVDNIEIYGVNFNVIIEQE